MVAERLRIQNRMKRIRDSLYAQIIDNVPIACVDVAIVYDGRMLLVLRKDKPAQGSWWLPGGRVHKGEQMIDTALRKAREEVGLDCFVGPLVHTAETIFPDGPQDRSVHSINSCFLLYPKGRSGPVSLDTHHSMHRFVGSIEEGLHPYVKACLKACGLKEEETEI